MSIRVPPGATGIAFDRSLYRFVVSFNGASDKNIGKVVASGLPIEDRVMFVDVPVFVGEDRRYRTPLSRSQTYTHNYTYTHAHTRAHTP